jgi:hypothetical protein
MDVVTKELAKHSDLSGGEGGSLEVIDQFVGRRVIDELAVTTGTLGLATDSQKDKQ